MSRNIFERKRKWSYVLIIQRMETEEAEEYHALDAYPFLSRDQELFTCVSSICLFWFWLTHAQLTTLCCFIHQTTSSLTTLTNGHNIRDREMLDSTLFNTIETHLLPCITLHTTTRHLRTHKDPMHVWNHILADKPISLLCHIVLQSLSSSDIYNTYKEILRVVTA